MIINPRPGFVAFHIEAWPHEPGGNGEHWSSGCRPAAEVAAELRRLANHLDPNQTLIGDDEGTCTPAQIVDYAIACLDGRTGMSLAELDAIAQTALAKRHDALRAEVQRIADLCARTAKAQGGLVAALLLDARDKLRDALDASAATAPPEAPQPDIAKVLTEHYLFSLNCDHERKTDTPWCGCSKVDLGTWPTVGEAVQAWVRHVLDQLPADVPPEGPASPPQAPLSDQQAEVGETAEDGSGDARGHVGRVPMVHRTGGER